jgi:GH15 family glucan-1,4-alpha-glucosidase
MDDSGYLPIADHGIIGDLHTVALVGANGTIDWYCCPAFDSPSVFASILDKDKGGFYSISPADDDWTSRQLYFPDTNVLITRFFTDRGVAEQQAFMPIARTGKERHRHRLIRRIVCVRGVLRFRLVLEPRFNYGRDSHVTHQHEHGIVFESDTLCLALQATTPFACDDQGVHSEFSLEAGQSVTFVLEQVERGYAPRRYEEEETREAYERTIAFWRTWLSQSQYRGRWREMVQRSALTLKLLTYQPTGAIVAAPTTSLPETIGGTRNWDYRYTWIRDAAFSLYGLLRLGFTEEAGSFMDWLTDRFRDGTDTAGDPLQTMYGLDGRRELPEEVLDHFEGYRGSRPVRIGNGAANQLQLDIYGELIDSVYLFNKYGRPIYHEAWEDLRRLVDWVGEHWDQPDEGIWEIRGGRHDFTFSRLMCWVAVERSIRMARQRGLPADLVQWMRHRDDIYEQIMARGWSDERGAFVQHYGSDLLDSSLLLMPLVKFIGPTDPRWLSTLDAISDELVSDSLVYRYNPKAFKDGLDEDEGTFSICSFWYVEALTRAGRVDEARLAFEKMLTYANHLGLYSEEIGRSGELVGNFPQAFTHLALISAAFNLDRELG